MMHHRYRTRFFGQQAADWAESIGVTIGLVVFIWLCMVGLPILLDPEAHLQICAGLCQ